MAAVQVKVAEEVENVCEILEMSRIMWNNVDVHCISTKLCKIHYNHVFGPK